MLCVVVWPLLKDFSSMHLTSSAALNLASQHNCLVLRCLLPVEAWAPLSSCLSLLCSGPNSVACEHCARNRRSWWRRENNRMLKTINQLLLNLNEEEGKI